MRILGIERSVVRVSLSHDLGDAVDARLGFPGVIEEGEVAFLHLVAHVVSRLKIPHAIPVSGAIGRIPKSLEVERLRVRLEKPILTILTRGATYIGHSIHLVREIATSGT